MLNKIDVVRKEKGLVYVLGRIERDIGLSDTLFCSSHDSSTGAVINEDSFKENNSDYESLIMLSAIGIGIPFLIYNLMPKQKERRRKTEDYNRQVEEYRKANMTDLRKAVKDIRIYQGTIEEVSQELGMPLKRVDTEKSETFISGKDTFRLRVKAYCLGADAIVHYQPGSSIGTPVKYISEK